MESDNDNDYENCYDHGHPDDNEPYSWMEGPNFEVKQSGGGPGFRGRDTHTRYSGGGSGCILPILLTTCGAVAMVWALS